MNFKNTEVEDILECIQTQPHKFIRLCYGKTGITNFNRTNQDRELHFAENIKPFLLSKSTQNGIYTIEGKNAGKAVPYKMLTIQKGDITEMETDEKPNQTQNRNAANFDLLSNNAELKYKVKFLEEKVEQLTQENKLLIDQIADLESQEEEEEEPKPMLSESQTILLNLAAPLIPLLQESAVQFLSKYLNKPVTPNLPTNEPQQLEATTQQL